MQFLKRGDVAPPKAAILAQLERIVSGQCLSSDRQKAILRIIVEKTLEDGGAKEITIAQALGLPSYNPQVDSIVRVEIGRVRDKLKDYYVQSEKEHRDERVYIALPKGPHYCATFSRSSSSPLEKLASSCRKWKYAFFTMLTMFVALLLWVVIRLKPF